jgi:hypothetical protein
MKRFINKWTILGVLLIIAILWAINVDDWHQLWIISSAPDNVPIVAMLFLVPFFTWLGIKQAVANDRLIDELEKDTKLAKSHHRKVEPWRPGWAREISSASSFWRRSSLRLFCSSGRSRSTLRSKNPRTQT